MKKSPLRLQRGLLDRRFCAARRVARFAQGGRRSPTGAYEMKRGSRKNAVFVGNKEMVLQEAHHYQQ